MAATYGLASLSTAVPDRGQVLDELALGHGDLADVAEQLGVDGLDGGHDADDRVGDGAQLGDVTQSACTPSR